MYKQIWDAIPQYHIPRYMDDYVEEEADLEISWKWNIMVDSLCDEYYDDDQISLDSRHLSDRLMGFMHHKGDPITRPIGKWAREHVSLKRAQQVFQESHPSALAGLQINWASIHTIAKT